MDNPNQIGIVFVLSVAIVLVAIAKLIQRGDAKTGVISILIVLPFLTVLGFYFLEGGSSGELENISYGLVISVVGSLIAALILFGIGKK